MNKLPVYDDCGSMELTCSTVVWIGLNKKDRAGLNGTSMDNKRVLAELGLLYTRM